MGPFEFALKGHGFSRAVTATKSMRLYRLRKNSTLLVILGGAALQPCDNWPVFTTGFSRRGKTAAWKTLFPQPL
jgi:hypothetical protein